jgi:sulfur-oxidizing protein SoxY
MNEERHMKPMTICVALGLALLGATPASTALGADPGMDAASDPARSARWKAISEQIFGDRRIEPSGALIKLDAPQRAEDASLVPVKLAMTTRTRSGRSIS